MKSNLKSNTKTILLPLEEIENGLTSLKEIITKKSKKIKMKTRHKKEFPIFNIQMNGAKILKRSVYLLNM